MEPPREEHGRRAAATMAHGLVDVAHLPDHRRIVAGADDTLLYIKETAPQVPRLHSGGCQGGTTIVTRVCPFAARRSLSSAQPRRAVATEGHRPCHESYRQR